MNTTSVTPQKAKSGASAPTSSAISWPVMVVPTFAPMMIHTACRRVIMPRIDKAHDHDGGRGGGLDHRRDARADRDPQQAVARQPLQNPLHAVARRRLEPRAHHLHPV